MTFKTRNDIGPGYLMNWLILVGHAGRERAYFRYCLSKNSDYWDPEEELHCPTIGTSYPLKGKICPHPPTLPQEPKALGTKWGRSSTLEMAAGLKG